MAPGHATLEAMAVHSGAVNKMNLNQVRDVKGTTAVEPEAILRYENLVAGYTYDLKIAQSAHQTRPTVTGAYHYGKSRDEVEKILSQALSQRHLDLDQVYVFIAAHAPAEYDESEPNGGVMD